MIPILYAKNETSFDSNGIGLLKDATSCIVTEERNGEFTMQLQYPINGNWYSSIGEGSIIKAKPNDTSSPQLFRVYKSSKPMSGIVTFSANHISYDLSGLPVMDLQQNNVTAAVAMTSAFQACPIDHPFTAWSDLVNLGNVNIEEPKTLRSFIGGNEDSILSKYGGELEFDNYVVKLHANRGTNQGVVINYGKNLKDIKQEQNINAVYTHICPYAVITEDEYNAAGEIIGQEKEIVKLTENVIALEVPNRIGHTRTLIVDLTDKFEEDESITESNLRVKAQEYIASNNLDTPEVNITINILQIWDSPEYQNFAAIERIQICDTVTVHFEDLGITAQAKVVKTVYDTLLERFTTLTLGSEKYSLADTVGTINNKIESVERERKADKVAQNSALNNAILAATNLITGNSGGYVVLHPANHPSEILIMDTDNIATAEHVWRWNSSGLGYSGTGYEGPYGLAMTIDGKIVADFITAGTLSANVIKSGILSSTDGRSYFNLETGEIVMMPYEEVADRVEEIESQKMLRLVIISSNGNIFKNGNISTTLSAKVYSWDEDITDTLDDNQFRWTRVSADAAADTLWNQAHYGGTKSITITGNDVSARATFYCDLVDPNTNRSLL